MSESLFREAEYHNGRSAPPVYYNLAGVRYKGLFQVDIQHIQTPCLQDFMYNGLLLFVLYVGVAAGKFGQSILCYVVLGRSKASCRNDYIVVF